MSGELVSEDEDPNEFMEALSPILCCQRFDDSDPVTPPTDYSNNLMTSLGLVRSSQGPCRKLSISKVSSTPKTCNRSKLGTPGLTPRKLPWRLATRPSFSPNHDRSLFSFNVSPVRSSRDDVNHNPECKASFSALLSTPKSCVRLALEDTSTRSPPSESPLRSDSRAPRPFLVSPVDHIPVSLVNPFSAHRTPREDANHTKLSSFCATDEEEDDQDDAKQVKKPKLSDFHCHKFVKEFLVLGILGSGAYGCVYKCLHLLTGKEYAVKRSLKPVNNEKVARNEIFAHAVLEHPNIVRNYVSWTEDDYVFMQNEYCNGGSLEDHIKNNGPMEEKELMVLLEHLAQGLRYIHKSSLAHMDLKPANVFLSKGPKLYYKHHNHHISEEDSSKEEVTYKIGDLGHVVKVDTAGYVEDGDCRYLPREMLNQAHPDYSKVDIFALGLTLYEAAGGGPLPKNGDEWHLIRNGHIKSFPHLSAHFINFVKRMIKEDPKIRPSACELLDEICRDEAVQRQLQAANQKIHLLQQQISDIVKTVSENVKAKNLRKTHSTRTINNNNINIANRNGVTPTSQARLLRSRSTC